jgi:ATP-dependent Clp protease ATP-binding subunit ClpA
LFARFSPAARRVLRAAEQECRNHNHYYVGVEHILVALLEEHDPRIDACLHRLGVRGADVHAEVRRALGTGEDRLWEGILVTPRVRSVVRLAENAVPPDAPIEPVHLFEAILAEGKSVAAEIVERSGRNDAARPGVGR